MNGGSQLGGRQARDGILVAERHPLRTGRRGAGSRRRPPDRAQRALDALQSGDVNGRSGLGLEALCAASDVPLDDNADRYYTDLRDLIANVGHFTERFGGEFAELYDQALALYDADVARFGAVRPLTGSLTPVPEPVTVGWDGAATNETRADIGERAVLTAAPVTDMNDEPALAAIEALRNVLHAADALGHDVRDLHAAAGDTYAGDSEDGPPAVRDRARWP